MPTDPNQKPQEPQRTSQPTQPNQPPPPMEMPGQPNTEYEKQVPHEGNQPIARVGEGGEGSYEGTQKYDNGLDQFSKQNSPEQSFEKGRKIDVDDPALKQAEQAGKQPAKTGGERKPQLKPDEGRPSSPSTR